MSYIKNTIKIVVIVNCPIEGSVIKITETDYFDEVKNIRM